MGWNYRIVRKKVDNFFEFGIYEAYYHGKQKKPWAITEELMCPSGYDMEELVEDFDRMKLAFGEPTLDHETREEIT